MIKCVVYGCLNNVTNSDSSIQFYTFPKHPMVVQQWINACCIWRPDELDINTSRVCSIHFDANSYTSEYKMLDYLGLYTKVLKYDAIPTLYLPHQTVVAAGVIKPPTETHTQADMKQMIVYGVPNNQVQNVDTSYGPNNIIMESQLPQIIPSNSKFEQVRNMSTHITAQPDQVETKIETEATTLTTEHDAIYEMYRNISAKQFEELKTENNRLKNELSKLEETVANLKCKLNDKIDVYKQKDTEYNRLFKLHNAIERKAMSVGDQKNLLAKVFSESQIKILSGKKKIYWSNDDMAIGYTIRHMSSKRCYMYLSKHLNIPLPALSSIKRWQKVKNDENVKEEKTEKDEANDFSDD